MMEKPYIELKDISKSFGEVQANCAINLQINKGEIHALLGENGSGKTTLMNILTGVYAQDEGSISIDGREVFFHSPADSLCAGIGMIHQHVQLVEILSVAENITAGVDKKTFINQKKLREKIGALSGKLGFKIDPDKKVYQLSVGEQQTVEILKVFYRGVNVLVLDEPTSVLTPQESHMLFETLLNMKCEGCSIILITHKMNEVFEISDKVTVLHKGRSLCTLETKETTQQELAEKMVGKAISLDIPRMEAFAGETKPVLELKDLVVENKRGKRQLDRVCLTVNEGEILGVAGIAGSGQRELCEAIAGLAKIKSGSIVLKGKEITGMSPRRLNKEKIRIAFVPEDRMNMGLAGGLSIADNVMMRSADAMKGVFLNRQEEERKAEDIIEKYEIYTSGPSQIVRNLSGGNIQKVLLGREMEMDPDFIITAYPVRGLDVGATNFVYDVLNREKSKGMGILFVGEDLDALMSLCDRIAVMHAGKLIGVVDARTITKNEIGLMMTGSAEERAHA